LRFLLKAIFHIVHFFDLLLLLRHHKILKNYNT
jgi:hypothetical protein